MAVRRRGLRRRLVQSAVLLYLGLVAFALFNGSSRCRTEMPTMYADPLFTVYSNSERCKVDMNELGVEEVDIFEDPDLDAIASSHPHVQPGGKWSPSDCKAWQKVAIVVPYRNRWHHLKLLLKRLHTLLFRQKIHYQIFLIEQSGQEKFNRGRLLNIGVVEALKEEHFDCFIFHDVDLLPENDQNIYYCDSNVRHLASAIDEYRYHVMYYNYAGGVVALTRHNINAINGYSNDYWGWGNEDDDFSARTMEAGLLLSRPPEHIGRYKMVRHIKQWRAENGYDLFITWQSRWHQDGLNSLHDNKYRVVSKTHEALYTLVRVDVGVPPAEPPISPDAAKQSHVWFLKFFFP